MKRNYYIFNPGRLKRTENSLQFIKSEDEKLYLPIEGELTESQEMELKYELKDFIREDKDSIIFFTSREEKWLNKDILGLNKNEFSNLL